MVVECKCRMFISSNLIGRLTACDVNEPVFSSGHTASIPFGTEVRADCDLAGVCSLHLLRL